MNNIKTAKFATIIHDLCSVSLRMKLAGDEITSLEKSTLIQNYGNYDDICVSEMEYIERDGKVFVLEELPVLVNLLDNNDSQYYAIGTRHTDNEPAKVLY